MLSKCDLEPAFPGSVVASYRTAFANIFGVDAEKHDFLYVIGVNWGYIIEKDTGENTRLNGVVAAWKILEPMEVPALRDKHDKATADLKNGKKTLEMARPSRLPPQMKAILLPTTRTPITERISTLY